MALGWLIVSCSAAYPRNSDTSAADKRRLYRSPAEVRSVGSKEVPEDGREPLHGHGPS